MRTSERAKVNQTASETMVKGFTREQWAWYERLRRENDAKEEAELGLGWYMRTHRPDYEAWLARERRCDALLYGDILAMEVDTESGEGAALIERNGELLRARVKVQRA